MPHVDRAGAASEACLEQVLPLGDVGDLRVGAGHEVGVAGAGDAVRVDRDLDHRRPVARRDPERRKLDERVEVRRSRREAHLRHVDALIGRGEVRPLVAGAVSPDVLALVGGTARDEARVVEQGRARKPIGRRSVDRDRVGAREQYRPRQCHQEQSDDRHTACPPSDQALYRPPQKLFPLNSPDPVEAANLRGWTIAGRLPRDNRPDGPFSGSEVLGSCGDTSCRLDEAPPGNLPVPHGKGRMPGIRKGHLPEAVCGRNLGSESGFRHPYFTRAVGRDVWALQSPSWRFRASYSLRLRSD